MCIYLHVSLLCIYCVISHTTKNLRVASIYLGLTSTLHTPNYFPLFYLYGFDMVHMSIILSTFSLQMSGKFSQKIYW